MQPLAHLALVVVQLLFASLAIAGRFVLPHFPAGALVTVRVLGAMLVLLALNIATGGSRVHDRRDLLHLAVLGMLGIAANQTLFLYGLRHTTAINATILVTTVPVFTVLGSVLTRREPASLLKFAGVAIAGAGAVYLIGPDRISLAPDVALGNALIVLGMVCYAAYFLSSKSILQRYSSVTVSFYVMFFACFGVLPFGIAAVQEMSFGDISGSVWIWVAYIILFPTIVTYLLNLWALKRASSNLVAVYIYLQPIFTAAVAPLILTGEHLSLRATVAGLSIFTGLGMVIVAELRQQREIPVGAAVGE
ncbi:MAG TPA: DMT family transporter [Gemmatimonadales bacterium]|nr:DMT family transporter [Gemmatimonadales bacterium]